MFDKGVYGSERAHNDCLSCGGAINSSNSMCMNCETTTQTFRTHYCSQCANRIEIANGKYPYCALPCDPGKTLYVDTVLKEYGICADCSVDEDLDMTGVPEGYRCTCPGQRYIEENLCKKIFE